MTDTPDHHDTRISSGDQAVPAEQGAGLWVRAVARLVDFVVLALTNVVLVGLLGDVVGTVLGAAVGLAYFAVLESDGRQTPGKLVTGLRTIGPSGLAPTLEQAVRRNIWVAFGLVGVVPFIGGLIAGAAQLAAVVMIAAGVSASSGGGRGWHDRFAGGTRVVPTRNVTR